MSETTKPYYERDGQTIFHGDCREILPTLDKVDLILTDPPYGYGHPTNYNYRFTKSHKTGTKQQTYLKNDSSDLDLSWVYELPFERVIFGANCAKQPLNGSLLVWDKRGADGFSFLSDGEAAFWSEGKGVYIFSKNGQQARSQAGLHPTQKPIGLMRWCIEKAKATGTILDPFMGSGTTLRAAKDLGRKCIGIEIEEKYCEIAANRLRQGVLDFSS